MSLSRNLALFGAVMLAAGTAAADEDASHATSSYIMSVISAGLPQFDAAQGNGKAAVAKAELAPKKNVLPSGVTLMPAFTITEAKLPSQRQMLTYRGWTQPLIDKYMGPSDGLDRGVLNRLTLAQIWKKIPILGALPFIGTPVQMTIPERALDDAGANNPLKTTPLE
jgi:hypothetical protein